MLGSIGSTPIFFFWPYYQSTSMIWTTDFYIILMSLMSSRPILDKHTIWDIFRSKLTGCDIAVRNQISQNKSTTIDIHYMFDRLNNRCGLIISLRFYHLIYVVYVSRSIATLKKQNKKQTIVIWNMWRSWKIWTVTSQQFLFHIISWICCHQCFVHF